MNKLEEMSKKTENEAMKNEEKDKIVNLIKSIKSNIIMKKLFSNLNDIKKLNIIKYNKNIQNQLEINLEDYKIKSGKYIIYKKNGKGKEYLLDNNILIFEGDYINRKKKWKRKRI